MRATVTTLRTALRAADHTTVRLAVDLLVDYIQNNKPYPETLAELLKPVDGDDNFNQKLGLVRKAVGV